MAGASPEYEDCRRLATEQGVPLPRVYAAAVAAASDGA
ncbi:MAG: LarC family nickel insertion protein [Chloroflexota bacterium]|nr:LarC family nickel insertion protein [Chloroflexota bacterium]